MSILKWFDLGKPGAKLRFVRGEGKTKIFHLVILGLDKESPEWYGCIGGVLGFKPSPTGKNVLIRPFETNRLTLSDLRTVFPNSKQIQIASTNDVRLQFDGKVKLSPMERALTAAMQRAIPIGVNLSGHRVFETSTGPRFVLDETGRELDESMFGESYQVLRCDGSDHSIVGCADGFVMGLMAGSHAEMSDVSRFVDVVYGAGSSSDSEKLSRTLNAIDQSILKRLRSKFGSAGDAAYKEAQTIYENSPPALPNSKSEGYLPLPLAISVQELVKAFGRDSGLKVYVPNIGSPFVVSMLGDQYSLISEIDMTEQTRNALPPEIDIQYRQVHEKVPQHQISLLSSDGFLDDHFTGMLRDLSKRFSHGLTIVTFPEYVDADIEEKAKTRERVALFTKQLEQDYQVLGYASLAPIMRKKVGLSTPLCSIIVGPRLSESEKAIRGDVWVPAAKKSLFDWDELRTFTNDVLVRAHEAAGRKLSAEEEAALRENEAVENSYQLPYQSFSQRGEVELMIPRNLAAATYKALQRIEDRVDNIDSYVQNAIGFTDEQFGYLAPEQIDAGALSVAALDRGMGFVLGDQTGAGKGVTLAMSVSYAWERGIPVIFITKQDNLFSDFYRDLKNVGLHEKLRPLILNHDSMIVDQFSEDLNVIARGISRKSFLQNHRFGLEGFDNPNIVFSTYSQFSSGIDSQKSDWIKGIARDCLVIFDESHIAAGDASRLGDVCTEVANLSKAVVFSSATWLKDARQTKFYQRALPKSVDAKMVADAMKAGGEQVQETFTAMLAADGLFIRRERDSSQLEIHMRVDEARISENERIANNVSTILQGLQRLCGVTDQVGRRLTGEQTKKLDRAEAYLSAALDRAEIALRAQLAELERDQVPSIVADVSDEIEQAQEHVSSLQRQINDQTLLENNAATENDELIESGQAFRVTSSADTDASYEVLSSDGQTAAREGDSHDEWTLEDFGLTQDVISEIRRVDTGGRVDPDGLKAELRRIKMLRNGVNTRTSNFGSFLFLTQRTLNVSLQARFAADVAIEAIENGQKPVIFLEQTFETALADAIAAPDAIKNPDGTYTIRPLTLKDNLRSQYQSILRITHTDAEGQYVEGSILESRFLASDEEKVAVRDGLQTLNQMIDSLPDDLYCSPFDTIAMRIRKAGYSVGEASGRKLRVVDEIDGLWRVGLRSREESKISFVERAFNSGETDALIGNKAMSTGLSIHASRDFVDQRQRISFFVQIFSDINDYMQAMGRTDRRNQVINPIMAMCASGLPSESRVMMNHYGKLRKLQASATSNRSSKFELQDLPDLFNSVGDRSVCEFMQANPGIPVRLGIDFTSFMPPGTIENREVEVNSSGLAKFTMARLDLLPVNEARNVGNEIDLNFKEIVRELDAQGINPFRTNVLNLTDVDQMREEVEDLLPSVLNEKGEVDSVFDEAVELRTYICSQKIKAKMLPEIMLDIEENSRRLLLESNASRKEGKPGNFIRADDQPVWFSSQDIQGPLAGAVKLVPAGLREHVEKMFDAAILMMLSSDAARAKAECRSDIFQINGKQVDQMSPLEIVKRRKNWILANLGNFIPGQYIHISEVGQFGQVASRYGVVTNLVLPPKGRETNFSRWGVTVHYPGYQQSHHYTLSDLYKYSVSSTNQWLPGVTELTDGLFHSSVEEVFNRFRETDYRFTRHVLTGNLFRAASIAAEKRFGAGGVLQVKGQLPTRVISLKHDLAKEVIYAAVPVEISRDELAHLFVTTAEGLDLPPSKSFEYWSDFMRRGVDARGVHSSKDIKNSDLSLYWMAERKNSRNSWMNLANTDNDDEFRDDDALQVVESSDGQPHLLNGLSARISLTRMPLSMVREMLVGLNNELGFDAVKLSNSNTRASKVRVVLRFYGQDGSRDTPDQMRAKINVFVRHVIEKVIVSGDRFYAQSPQMRLLSLSVSEQRRAQVHASRTAAEEARVMRIQMARLNIAESDQQVVEDDSMDMVQSG